MPQHRYPTLNEIIDEHDGDHECKVGDTGVLWSGDYPCLVQCLAAELIVANGEVTMSLSELDPIIKHLIEDGTREGLILGDDLNRQMGRSARRDAVRKAGASTPLLS